jgi:putative DNA primase/helicase
MNSNFMKKFRAPAGVKHLVVFADMDRHSATGQAAAFECAHANLLAKNDLLKVSVRWPDNGDFNDLLMNGDQVRRIGIHQKTAGGRMKMESGLKHFSPQGMHISDSVNKTGAQKNA